jgi:dihydroneopterin aldolase
VTSQLAITLRGMRFHVRVGVLPHEHEIAQPLEVDVTVWRACTTAARPAAAVLDYRTLYDAAARAVAADRLAYLEDVAADLADRALVLDDVERVRVAVRKPHVALAGPLEFAEVVLERTRDA